MEPVQYPTVAVGGKPYLLRFGMNALFRLNTWGVPAGALGEYIQQLNQQQRNIELTITLAAAALGNMAGEKWQSAGFTPETLADSLDNGEYLAIVEAVATSLGKASPGETSAPTQPATMMEPPANQGN